MPTNVEKTVADRAKPAYGTRPSSEMRLLVVLVGLSAISGCFNPTYQDCRILCSENETCPGDLHCVPRGTEMVCASPQRSSCLSMTEPGAAPEMICLKGECYTLPLAVREGVTLLLWPTALPEVGSPVNVWPDVSGRKNDAQLANPAVPVQAMSDGVPLGADGAGFVVTDSPSLDFAASDFVVAMAAGLATITPGTLFQKTDASRTGSRQVKIRWAVSGVGEPTRVRGEVNDIAVVAGSDITVPSVAAFVLRRSRGHVELRINGVVVGSGDLAMADASTSNGEDVLLGLSDPNGAAIASLGAVVVVIGAIEQDDLRSLEDFLVHSFATAQ